MDRTHDALIPADTPWLSDPDAQALCQLLTLAGREVYFVGGCVRDTLMGRPAGDVDLSTRASPQEIIDLATAAGLKALPTGIDHGTITVVVNGKPYEVTTFRRDVETDGRRAVVAFADTVDEDAQRRDFTMNALYAAPDGRVVDPVGGLPDLAARRLRFIGDAEQRIREDYLRSLRFFRFYAWLSDPSEGPDPDALDAIARTIDGLGSLSAERVGAEVLRLLQATDPAPSVSIMRQTGVLQQVLPGADDRWLAPLVHLEGMLDQNPDPLCRLAALGGQNLKDRLRLSRANARQLDLLRDVGFGAMALPEIAYRHGSETAIKAGMLRAVMAESVPDVNLMQICKAAARNKFPITAKDLSDTRSGPALGEALRLLETWWIASGFQLDKAALLDRLAKDD